MSFVSLQFIGFVAGFVFIYYLCPVKYRWMVLLAGSTLFYWLLVRRRIVFIIFSCVTTWLAGLALGRLNREGRSLARRRLVLAAFLCANIGLLLLLKFFPLVAGAVPFLQPYLLMPVGISFYTLQVAGYVMDVYRKKAEPEKNPFKVALFTTFFPQLIQGPISRFKQLEPQLITGHRLEYDNLVYGAQRMLWGYFKKLVIADRLAVFTRSVYEGYEQYFGFYVALAACLYVVQLYADFSGGIDIALGVGRLFGIQMPENFNRPLFSKSVAEFWRRWHITLGAWLRDYVYYPLNMALTRRLVKKKRLVKWMPVYVSLLVVWLLNGLWHGEGLQYICNGLWYGGLIMLGTAVEKPARRFWQKLRVPQHSQCLKIFRVGRTFGCVAVAQIMFGSASFAMMMGLLQGMFRQWNPWILFDGSLLALGLDGADWAVALLAMGVLLGASLAARSKSIPQWLNSRELPLRWGILLAGIAAVAVFGVYGPAYDPTPFIYFQF